MSATECTRCRRPFPGWESAQAVEWEAIDDDGNMICPGCLTGEEEQAIDEDGMETARLAREDERSGPMTAAYHRTTAVFGDAILRDGFEDQEGSWGTGQLWSGVWVTIDKPWSLVIAGLPPGDDPALLVVEIPMGLFISYEWVEEGKGYREALIPAQELNRCRVWRAWECIECGAVVPEGTAGWHSGLLGPPHRDRSRISTCPDCTQDDDVAER